MANPQAGNDNTPRSCRELQAQSRQWLSREFGFFDCSQPKLELALNTLMPAALNADDRFTPQGWLDCLLHFETLLQPMADDDLIGLRQGAYIVTGLVLEEEGLDAGTAIALRQFSKHETLAQAMIAEGAYMPQLAVDCGMLDCFHDMFKSELPTAKELERSARQLLAHCRRDQHEILPHCRWLAFNELIDIGFNPPLDIISDPVAVPNAPVRPPATIIDLQARRSRSKKPNPQPN